MVRSIVSLYRRAYVGLPKEIWMLSMAMFINRSGTMVLPFFTLYLTTELGYTDAAAGRLLSVYGLGSIAGVYMGGRLLASVSPMRIQTVFFALAVPMYLAIPFFRQWWSIGAAMFLLSFFCDGIRPANATAITQFAPKHLQVRAFGLQRMALNLGVSFGPAIGGILATINFVWLFVADAATTFLCVLTLLACFGWRKEHASSEPQRARAAHDNRSTSSPLRDRAFLAFIGLLVVTAVVFLQIHTAYPLFLSDHYQLSKPAIGLIYAVNTVVVVLVEMLLLDFIRNWPLLPMMGWGTFLSCLGFGMLPFGDSVTYCVLSMLVLTLGEMLWMPLASGWVAQRSARGNQGMYMGWYTMTFSLAAVIAPTLGGALYQYAQNLVWYLSLAAGVATLVGFYALHAMLQRQAAPASTSRADGGAVTSSVRPESGPPPCAEVD